VVLNDDLLERVALLADAPASGVRIGPRAPLDHQSNRLYDAWTSSRHLIVKEYLKPDEFSTGPIHEHRALELWHAGSPRSRTAPQAATLDRSPTMS
jgi:hypothetical protein